jgi:hypothetical protein
MKLHRKWHLLVLFGIMVCASSSSRALNCTFVLATPGFIEFPSSGGQGFVNVSVGPDSGCTYFVSPSGAAIQSVGFLGLGGFSFTANANPGPSNLNGTLLISTGQASSSVSVTVDPPSAVLLGGLTTAVDPVANTVDVEYVSGDGDVQQLWFNGTWHKTDLSALTGSPSASSTGGIKTAFDSVSGTMEVHYIGTDQHVHTLWYNGTWHTTDLTTTTGALNAISGSPLTVTRDTLFNTQDVHYIGTDQHVHLLWYDGSWHTEDLSAMAGAPNAASNSRLAADFNTLANTVEVHYLGTDQHIHSFWYNGTWHTTDLMTTTGALNAVAGSPITSMHDTLFNTQDIHYIGTDQHVHLLWYDGLWHTEDLSAMAGALNAASGSPLASDFNTLANTPEVHYLASDQHIHSFWYNGTWHTTDLMFTTGATDAVAGSPLTSAVDTIANTVDLEYVGTDRHVRQLWYNGTWHTTDLTAATTP